MVLLNQFKRFEIILKIVINKIDQTVNKGCPFWIISCVRFTTEWNTIGCFDISCRNVCFRILNCRIRLFTVSCLDIIRLCMALLSMFGIMKNVLSLYPLSARVFSPVLTDMTYDSRANLRSVYAPHGYPPKDQTMSPVLMFKPIS